MGGLIGLVFQKAQAFAAQTGQSVGLGTGMLEMANKAVEAGKEVQWAI